MSIGNEVKNITVLLRIYGALLLQISTQTYFPRRRTGLVEGVAYFTDSEMYFLEKFVAPGNLFSNVGCICIVGVFNVK
jgi:hypothetical protein